MKIKTNIDKYKDLIYSVMNCVDEEPLDKFETPYNKLIQVLMSNISENKDDLLVLYSRDIDKCNDKMSIPLSSATDRERAFYNVGRFRGLCDIIKNLGDYNESLEKFLKAYLDLEVGDIVYIVNNNIIYKTTVTKKIKKKIQVKYGNRWFTQDDYLEYIFPYAEKENLHKSGRLAKHSNCDKCSGYRQGKCAYGYSLYTYSGVTYRFDNKKYKVIKGIPTEICCKTIKK